MNFVVKQGITHFVHNTTKMANAHNNNVVTDIINSLVGAVICVVLQIKSHIVNNLMQIISAQNQNVVQGLSAVKIIMWMKTVI